MAAVGQVYYNVVDPNSGGWLSSGVDIFKDIVSAYKASRFTKLGIQAPAGTQVVVDDNKTIMVGRTGIYELDDEIEISKLYFVKPRLYEKNEAESERLKQQGEAGMREAETTRANALANLNLSGKTGDDYWEAYAAIQEAYITAYTIALNNFNQGSNGVYELPYPDNPDSELNYKDLYNVVVDFIYE